MTTELKPFLCLFSRRLTAPDQSDAVLNQENRVALRAQARSRNVSSMTRITKIEQETTDDD